MGKDQFSSYGMKFTPFFTGHGFASAPDRPKSYTFKKLLCDTQTIFDHFIPRNRECIVIAHSYGCSMAAALTRSGINIFKKKKIKNQNLNSF